MALSIVKADSVRAAAAVLSAEPGARFLGGGTLVVRDVNYGAGDIAKLILPDNLGLAGLSVTGGRATIGAAVTMAKIAREPALAFLKPVVNAIGGPAVRAMATVGGNLFAPAPYGDFAVALVALRATVATEGADGASEMPIDDFLASRERSRARIVKSVSFALPADGAFRFLKVARKKPHGASVLAIAAVLPVAGGKVAGASIAYGAMAPTAVRARAVEAALDGKALDDTAIAAAVKVAGDGTSPGTDPQASAWYRSAVLPVHLKRLLKGEA